MKSVITKKQAKLENTLEPPKNGNDVYFTPERRKKSIIELELTPRGKSFDEDIFSKEVRLDARHNSARIFVKEHS